MAATATSLTKHASAQMSTDSTPSPVFVEGPTSDGGGEEATYLGCFHDNPDDRVLGDKLILADMSTEVSEKDLFRNTDDRFRFSSKLAARRQDAPLRFCLCLLGHLKTKKETKDTGP